MGGIRRRWVPAFAGAALAHLLALAMWMLLLRGPAPTATAPLQGAAPRDELRLPSTPTVTAPPLFAEEPTAIEYRSEGDADLWSPHPMAPSSAPNPDRA